MSAAGRKGNSQGQVVLERWHNDLRTLVLLIYEVANTPPLVVTQLNKGQLQYRKRTKRTR